MKKEVEDCLLALRRLLGQLDGGRADRRRVRILTLDAPPGTAIAVIFHAPT